MYIRTFSEEQMQEMVDLYTVKKLAINKIAKIFKASQKGIAKILHKYGVVRGVGKNCLYNCDENFFETINTEEKAYWLGVIFADGNLQHRGINSYIVIFSSVDKDWVEMLKNALKYDGPIRREVQHKYNKEIWKISISNEKLYNDLYSLGCVPKKSLVKKFPVIRKDLVHHFIRGYFDGNGSVSEHQYLPGKDNTTLKSGFCSGSMDFLESLKAFIPAKHNAIKQHTSNCYTVTYGVKDSYQLYNYMYKDATIYLNRKREKFIKYAQERRSTTIIDPSLQDEGIV